jgi:hypothetical protein
MSIQISGTLATNIVEADATLKAMRVSPRPPEALNFYSAGAKTGLLSGLAANAPIFSFRNIGTNLVLLRRVGIGFVTTTAFTTAQIVDFGLQIARAFTASDSAGSAIALTGSNMKHRTAQATFSSGDLRVATTTALTAGTRTLDANPVSSIGAWSGAVGAGLQPAPANLFQHDAEDYPIVLANNEGFVIQNLTAMGAAGVVQAYVNVEFAEANAF